MNIVKEWVKSRLRKALNLAALEEKDKQLEEKISQTNDYIERIQQKLLEKIAEREVFNISYWYEGNLWEPPVQIALRDLCKPGNVVFDVGANFGGLTTVMSRMVGPSGVVCAFEASPRIVDKCQRNVVFSGCSNVQVYNVAVYSKSQEKVSIYLGSHLNDSIYAQSNADLAAFSVPTLAIDDFVKFTGLVPNLVKMDIEGAEFDAIKGMLNTIDKAMPHLILETQPHDSRCLDLLREKGYVAIDLNNYREIKNAEDYPKGVRIRNNLYIHQDRRSSVLYQPPFTFIETAVITGDEFARESSGSVSLKNPLLLNKGRYLIDVDFSANGTANNMMCGVKVGESVIFRYNAYTKLLAESYRDWVINLTEPSEIKLYFDFLDSTYDDTFSVTGAKVYRIAEFDNLPIPLYI